MLTVVVGGQFGSEGKGAVVGELSKGFTPDDICVRVGGPNAGHTVYDIDGNKWALRQVPAAAPVSACQLVIGAGSEIDLPVLLDEIHRLDAAGHRVSERLFVHPSATMLTGGHKGMERSAGLVGRIGSTGKGIGAARADRIMRDASTVRDLPSTAGLPFTVDPERSGVTWADLQSVEVLVEGTQGYGLGLHTDYYPKVTSSDCRAIDFLSMAGISPFDAETQVIVVVRPFPIRVAGESGPLQDETTWEELGLEPELTTVTRKVRRVGQWDVDLVRRAVAANGGPSVVSLAVTMVDHLFPQAYGVTKASALEEIDKVTHYLQSIERSVGAKVVLVGTSPYTMVHAYE